MLCILCGSQTRGIIHPLQGVFHHCPKCELITKDPSFHPSEEEALQEYSHHENFLNDPRYVAYFVEYIDKAVLPFMGEGKRALDFGSGPAPVLATVLDGSYGYQTDCYDLFFSPEKVYIDRSYDLITCTEVAEHLSDPLATFRLLASLLAPGGVLSLMTLLHNNDDERFFSWHYIREESHIVFYSPKTLGYIASLTALELLYCDGFRYACFGKNACPREEMVLS